MRINKVSVHRISIPFNWQVSHNLYNGTQTEAIVVVANDESGLAGYGEGTPRVFVTGETLDKTIEAANSLAERRSENEFHNFNDLVDYLKITGSLELSQQYPSAWCALELAILDLWAKREGKPLWQLFTQKPVPDPYVYSAAIPVVPEQSLSQLLDMIKKLRLEFVKLKIADRDSGISTLKLAREYLGSDVDLRVDCNGAFSREEALAFIEELQPFGISTIEQPVQKTDISGLGFVSRRSSIPVIADESMCTLEDAMQLIEQKACQGFSIKLSKCGGLIKCLNLLDIARANGIFCQISCHIGETAILAAAGRHFYALSHQCKYLEGSFSKYLLKEDIVTKDISFGFKGHAPLLTGPGLGIEVDESILKRWITDQGPLSG
jgi:L-Ala-D/L-Glu epimerase / N-acetyl-D-glutamate racemase